MASCKDFDDDAHASKLADCPALAFRDAAGSIAKLKADGRDA